MIKGKVKWLAILGMTVLMIILGGYREIVFVNINEQMYFNDGQIDDYRVLEVFDWLQRYDNNGLNSLKWYLTLGFSLLFLALGFITLRTLLRDKEGGRWMIFTYLGTIILAGLFFITGKIIGHQELGYTLSRVFMGALQSPFILMLMIPARMLVKRM